MPVRQIVWLFVLVVSFGRAGEARADVVSEAFEKGNTAASEQRWEDAVRAYEEAREVLPARSATLNYNLGTAYAHLDELGYATFFLERALLDESEPSVQIVESSTRNLSLVRRRAEVSAENAGARLSPERGWGDIVYSVFLSGAVGWLASLFSWCFGLGLVLVTWLRSSQRESGVATLLTTLALVLAVVGGVGHWYAVGGDRANPSAILLEQTLDIRSGPSAHRPSDFRLQGGSRVRVVQRTQGWSKIRTPEGLEGWAADRSLGILSSPRDATAAVALQVGPAVDET